MLYVLQLLGDIEHHPRTPTGGGALPMDGFVPGPHWATPVPQIPYTGLPS